MTKVELEHTPDLDMYIFFEKYMGVGVGVGVKSYNPKQESTHIIYVDGNNLYGYTMFKFLPTNGFKWLDPKKFDLNKGTSNSSKKSVLKVDLEYP